MKLAVLIDADNASHAIVGPLLNEVATLGTAIIRRIYGDFTQANLANWGKALADHAIQPIQQYRHTKGKNASDSALIIDAMDLLHGGTLDGFCLVSSDSDFTRLATRIRENGLTVYGFGERKTPAPFIAACDRFIYTELFRAPAAAAATATPPTPRTEQPSAPAVDEEGPKPVPPIRPVLIEAFEAARGDNAMTGLGPLGQQLQKRMPDFDPRTYGFRKLSDLVEAEPGFDLRRQKTGAGNDLISVEFAAPPPKPRRGTSRS